MTATDHTPPPPRWLVRLSTVSGAMAVLALCVLLWSKWGLAAVIATDLVRYCF